MSSTNRSNSRDSHVADYYVTPIPDIHDFLNAFLSNHPDALEYGKSILDPCAWGNQEPIQMEDGTVIQVHPMSYPTALKSYTDNDITTLDIRDNSPAQFHWDFLTAYTNPFHDIIITNPPFNLALPIIEKALDIVQEGWYVIMLLRLNFFGSKARNAFFKSNMPIETYVHHKRISFANGATDSIEYMHAVWRKWENPDFTKLYLI